MQFEKIRDAIFPNHIELYNEGKVPGGDLLVGLRGTEYEKVFSDGRSDGKVIKVTMKDNGNKVDKFRAYLKQDYTRMLGDENDPIVKSLDDDDYLKTLAIDIEPDDPEYGYVEDYRPSGGGKTRKRKRKSHKRKSHKRKSNKRKSHKRKSRGTRRR